MKRPHLCALAGTLLLLPCAFAQTPPPTPPPIDKNAPEMTTSESPALFQTRINLVSVPVVVRDSKGHAVGTFTKENFQLLDKGKPQDIARFSLEKAGDLTARAAKNTVSSPDAAPTDLPERFIAYLFDDLHLPTGDLARARDAVGRQLAKMAKTERAAIYTTSGQNSQDFTDDLDKLHATLQLLRSRSMQSVGRSDTCPYISEYVADRIVNFNDQRAINLIAQEQQLCDGTGALGAQTPLQVASTMVSGMAQQVAGISHQETHINLSTMKDIVRRVGATPGQRILVLVTNGFLASLNSQEKNEILDRAIKASVTINALEPRGLWTDQEFDLKFPTAVNSTFATLLRQYEHDGAFAEEEVLTEFTAGSGGSFHHDNNDLDLGVRQATAAPEFYYVLAFSPQNLKLDGSFHMLKVALKSGVGYGLDIQARKGYYAPMKLADAEENAKEEMREALFSRDEISELPAELRAKFFRSGEKDATVTVVCRLDPKHIRYRKADGRNINSIRVLTGLFDRNGNLVSAMLKKLDIQMKDETMAKLTATGTISLSTNFSVQVGSYMIRMVVVDTEGQQMSALNGAVAIQ